MTGYQQIIVVGNIGKEAELKYLQSGQPFCNFSLAVNERWHNSAGEPQDKTTWFRVTLWGTLAENLHQYLIKGKQVMVVGSIDARAYVRDDGQTAASLELRARDVRLLGKKDGDNSGFEPVPPDDVPF